VKSSRFTPHPDEEGTERLNPANWAETFWGDSDHIPMKRELKEWAIEYLKGRPAVVKRLDAALAPRRLPPSECLSEVYARLYELPM
jgi:hypothetical protein